MPVFEYKGVTSAGKEVKGVRDADSGKALHAILRKEGIFLMEVLSQKQAESVSLRKGIDLSKLLKQRVPARDVAVMTRQLAVLIGAGVALVEALSTLQDQVDHEYLKLIISQIKNRVNEGGSLADALALHPKIFSNLYINMIRAGEHSGALDVVLMRLADFTENQAQLRSKVLGTMLYPIIMVFVGFINLGVLFTFVVPKVIRIFDDNKLTLPLSTKILIFINQTVQDYWWLLLIGVSFSIWGFLTWKKSPSGRVRWDQLVLKSPIIGPLVKMIAVARFSRTMSTLLKSGVPLLTALDIVKNIVNNAILAAVIENSRDSIREGESIAAPLRRSGQFPPLMYHMIAIGERSGQLEEMLINVANTYESQVEVQVSAMTSLLGPVMIVLMGAIVAFIVISILLPILKLNTMVHG